MALPYAHLALAQGCLPHLDVPDPTDFYLGSVMPDIRYFTQQPRGRYHFPAAQVAAFAGRASPSFLLGYTVHLIVDEVWGTDAFIRQYRRDFPLVVRRSLTPRLLALIFEIFCLTRHPVRVQLQATDNAMLRALGVTPHDLAIATTSLQRYVDAGTLQAGLHIAQASGMYPPKRLAEMETLVRRIDSSRLAWLLVRALAARSSQPAYARLIAAVRSRVGAVAPCP